MMGKLSSLFHGKAFASVFLRLAFVFLGDCDCLVRRVALYITGIQRKMTWTRKCDTPWAVEDAFCIFFVI